ncbi:MAG: ferrous iron transport protein B [Vicingaceae bacterium]
MSKLPKILLVGNPNTGKSTIFNSLTGLNQKIGNFPGITVEKKSGIFQYKNKKFEVIDLPGTYSIEGGSLDEKVALEQINNTKENDIIVLVVDASNLKRNLMLAGQILNQGKSIIIALNMMDIAQKNNCEINVEKLKNLLQTEVIPLNARIKKGIDELKSAILNHNNKPIKTNHSVLTINEIVKNVVHQKGDATLNIATKKIDNTLLHPVFGYAVFLLLMFIIFQSIFYIAEYPMDLIEEGFVFLSNWLNEILPPGLVKSLVVDGVVAGLSGVLVFVPQIAILFLFIAILEDTGYMSRVTVLMDKILRPFGLNGKSIIPIMSSTACAVPSIMGTRTISNVKERLITIFIAPLISCSARLPVYTLLISFMIPSDSYFGPFNTQGLVLMGLYLLGFVTALLTAFILKFLIQQKEKSIFIIELPIYRWPKFSTALLTMYNQVKVFVTDAGKIIILISIILWGLSSFGPNDKINNFPSKYASEKFNHLSKEEKSILIANEKLENSYAGIIGKTIEPVIKPLGFDWKIGIAIISSFAAREVFVGTMATLYAVGEDDSGTLKEKMHLARDKNGNKIYSTKTALSLIIFYVFAMQCMATFAVVKRETNSWKWPIIQILYMGVLAYVGSLLVYQVF